MTIRSAFIQLVALTGALIFTLPAQADGYLGLELQLRTLAPTSEQGNSETILDIEPEIQFEHEHFSIYGLGRIRSSLDTYEPGRPNQTNRSPYNRRALLNDHIAAELRELYLTTQWQGVEFRIGKQQLVWGEADGLKVLDVINPASFTEFILEPFEDSRIPVWMASANHRFANIDAELVVVADPTAHEFAPQSSSFAFSAPRFALPANDQVETAQRRTGLNNPEIGLRLRTSLVGTDVAFMALRHFRDLPTYQDNGAAPNAPLLAQFHKETLFGVSATRAFSDFIARAEIGYTLDRTFTAANLSAPVRSDVVGGVLGLDWYGPNNWFVSAQYFVDHRLDDIAAADPRSTDKFATLAIRKQLAAERLQVSCTVLVNLVDRDRLIRPTISYEVSDTLSLEIGADVFSGKQNGVFGQFEDSSRVFASLTLAISS